MADTFIACSMNDCRWNKEGQCNAKEIFVDQGAMCSTFEPDTVGLGGMGLGGPRESFRDLLVGGGGGMGPPGPPLGAPPMAAGRMGPPMGGGGMMGGPPPVL